ncbi:hypothetical protein LTR36_009579 [Oleoguttula mirabilis]|uniref:alpha-1,2-Mannosidase n=1 Tax=Oleoguttula mirabilis TaxID=1507867 RepID=A0AAV9JT54_9PEZI|nr:hypothetical protein LTR36_009579 [Oleoguttula mirabilis]
MFSMRRLALSIGFSALFLVVLIQLEILRLPRSVSSKFTEPQVYRLPPKEDDGHFNWAALKTHYPVTSFEPLPRPGNTRLPRVQYDFPKEVASVAAERKHRQAEVKKTLQRCWKAYRERAWLEDELAPISGTGRNTFGGWAATLVDTLDVLWIMDMKDEFREAADAAVGIDFSNTTSSTINVFETTIRYLGGFLAAYDLSGDQRLLDKSLELAHMLYAAFDTPNRMPITRWDFHKAASGERQTADDGVLVAEIGSLTLEFTRLSQITNDNKWYDAVARIMAVFDQQQDSTNLPGMWPLVVNARAQEFNTGTVFTLGAMSDSVYEYLPKMYALLGGSDRYARLYKGSMSAAIKHSLFRPMLPDNADVLVAGPVHADDPGKSRLEPQGQHLVCFAGGMLALGGRLLEDEMHVQTGRKLTDGCIWTYEASELGIMPETFFALPCEGQPCTWDEAKWHADVVRYAGDDAEHGASSIIETKRLRPGFSSIDDRRYILRPEAIESVFVLYRITGDEELREKAWTMFSNINKHTETGIANAAISDMTDPSAPKSDSMESFWTAETLKYFYLIFSDPGLISLDDYVFNTEAHPLKRPNARFWG